MKRTARGLVSKQRGSAQSARELRSRDGWQTSGMLFAGRHREGLLGQRPLQDKDLRRSQELLFAERPVAAADPGSAVGPGSAPRTRAWRRDTLRRFLPHLNSGQVPRLLKRLRLHGLIKKVAHGYKYYVTTFGKDVLATGLKLRELVIIPTNGLGSRCLILIYFPACFALDLNVEVLLDHHPTVLTALLMWCSLRAGCQRCCRAR
jgi:hypothetical protein